MHNRPVHCSHVRAVLRSWPGARSFACLSLRQLRFDALDVLPSISCIINPICPGWQVPGGYHIWCVGSMVPKWYNKETATRRQYKEALFLVVTTCQQLKDACTSGAHSSGRGASMMINLAMVPIVSRKNLWPSELAGVIREATDLIRPQMNVLRIFTFDRLSWQFEQLLDHGFLFIVVEQDTPGGLYRAPFTMPSKHAIQQIQDLLACEDVQYAHVLDAIKRQVQIDAGGPSAGGVSVLNCHGFWWLVLTLVASNNS